MPITLKHLGTSESVDLSDRLVWSDEFARNPVAAEQRWGTTGALMLHVGVRQAGLPITLEGVESQAWLTRAVVQQLDAWAQLPNQTFELTLRGQLFAVRFDHSRAPAFDAQPLWRLLDGEHTPDLVYRPTFHFIEI